MFFVLSLEHGSTRHADPRVKDTVVHFVLAQLRKDKNVIFYVCSARDNRERARQRLFTRWYRQNKPSDIIHAQRVVEGDSLFFVYHSSNELAEKILELIDQYNLTRPW